MRRITVDDEQLIIRTIAECSARTCSWENVREQLAKAVGGIEKVWSRQALKAHPKIYSAYLAKVQSRRGPVAADPPQPGEVPPADNGLETAEETELQALQRKYDELALRHRQLAYNASLLPGGLNLLIDPLPAGQQARDHSRPKQRRAKR